MSEHDSLRLLHREVDDASDRLTRVHTARIRCERGCHDCCVDDLTVFEIEAERIRLEQAPLLRTAKPHAVGACAFLDSQGGCRIYDSRPYVCRTQGLPLRWSAESEDGQTIEYRDICPLNDTTGPPIESLDADDCFLLGPYESRLHTLQQERHSTTTRVALRDLFQP